MIASLETLDIDALKQVRQLVKSIQLSSRKSIPMADLVKLPATLPGGISMIVDYRASREVGHEVIIFRIPAVNISKTPDPRFSTLSIREVEICGLVAMGLSNRQIADKLFVSLATVKTYVHHIFKKTGITNRAAIIAVFAGLATS